MRVCIVGASGKLGRYMVRHALDRGYEVVGVCRPQSVEKLDSFKEQITIVPGKTDDREVIRTAVDGCDGVLTVLVPWGMHGYSTGTAQAVLDFAPQGARLAYSKAAPGGQSFVAATSKRGRVRACRSGVGTSGIRSSAETRPAASTLPSSWWPLWRTTNLFTRRRRSRAGDREESRLRSARSLVLIDSSVPDPGHVQRFLP